MSRRTGRRIREMIRPQANLTPLRRDGLLLLALLVLAAGLRAYRLSANPLWLDELFETQLVRHGPAAILRNSLWEPAPPLYHLLLWLGSGLGRFQTEWAFRWVSVLAGALTVPLVYVAARRVAGWGGALFAALLLVISPAHLYYSQEARSYAFSAGLAALSAWTLLTGRLAPAARWRLWAGLTVVGVWTNYAYAMVALTQALVAVPQAWRAAGGRAALLAASAGLLASGSLAAITLPKRAAIVASGTLDLATTVQALAAGDMLRYGRYWGHIWLTTALVALAVLGVWRVARRGPRAAVIVFAAQAILPLAGYFLIARPLLGIDMEAYQTRQFVVLLPAAFVLVGAGAAQAWELAAGRLGRWLAAGVGLALASFLLFGSLAGVRRYWAQTKSPEGMAVLYLRDGIAPGEAVVSLHYSVDAAMSFYGPEAPRFTKPVETPEGAVFSDSVSVLLWEWIPAEHPYTLADLAAYPNRWVVSRAGQFEALTGVLMAGCRVTDEAEFWPFRVVRVEACATTPATPTAP